MNVLIEKYNALCNQIIEAFCKKQGLDFEFWVGDVIGETACFGLEWYFNFNDILLDLTKDYPKGLIIEWHNADMEFNIDKDDKDRQFIKYEAYAMGLRHKHFQQN